MQDKILTFSACFACLLTGYAASSVVDIATLFSGKEILLNTEQKVFLMTAAFLFLNCILLAFSILENSVTTSKIDSVERFLNRS